MEESKNRIVYDALAAANRLYEQYFELAHVAEFSNIEIDERDSALWAERSLAHPLGLTITTK